MKHIIFKNNTLFRLASTDAKKDHWLNIEPGIITKQVSDEDFKAAALRKKIPSLSGDNISWDKPDVSQIGLSDDPITDAAVVQEKLSYQIEVLKKSIESLKLQNNSEAESLLNFLNTIDVTTKTTGSTQENLLEYIYNLQNCPQVFIDDLTY